MSKREVNLKLKAAIVECGKTAAQVAEECNMSETALSRRINGFGKFNEVDMPLISKAVNKPISEIFFNSKVTDLITSTG